MQPRPQRNPPVLGVAITACLLFGCSEPNPPTIPDQPTLREEADFVASVSSDDEECPCTPGYWKQPHHLDSWVGYGPNDSFNGVFGIGPAWFLDGYTLLDALEANGGGVNALARHAVAALLNATAEVSLLAVPDVIAQVQAAYDGLVSVEGLQAELCTLNDGCPDH